MTPASSPNDPVFFLHHCFIDKLWADWQRMHPDEQPYLPLTGAPAGHNLNDSMAPFNVTPQSMLDHHALGYAYDTEPECAPKTSFEKKIELKFFSKKSPLLEGFCFFFAFFFCCYILDVSARSCDENQIKKNRRLTLPSLTRIKVAQY